MFTKALSLLPCESVTRDVQTGEVTVNGIYLRWTSNRFPSPKHNFRFYAMLEGQPSQQVLCQLLMEESDEWACGQISSDITFPESTPLLHLNMGLDNVSFRKPGLHKLVLKVDSEVLAQRSFHVKRRSN